MIQRLLAAAALMGAALFAMPAAAADPPITPLPFVAGSSTYQEATYSDGLHFFVEHMDGGWTGSAWKPWSVDANGYGGVNVFSSALPTGAATQATLAQVLAALGTPLQANGSVVVTNLPTTQQVSAAALPLPAGAATALGVAALQTALGSPLQAGGSIGNTAFGAKLQDATGAAFGTSGNPIYIAGGGGGGSTPTGSAGTPTASVVSVQGITGATPVKTDGSATTQPISAAALPLPSGAATASGVAAVVTALGTPLQAGGNVAVTSSALPAGAATSAKQDSLLAALGSPLQAGGSVTVASSALPGGAATATAQASILAAETANVFFTPTTTALGASATFTGPTRDVGVAAGTGTAVSYFNAVFYADQAGTAYIDLSDDGTTWTAAVAGTPLVAATPLTLTAPLLARYYRARLVNGATAETVLRVSSAFSRN